MAWQAWTQKPQSERGKVRPPCLSVRELAAEVGVDVRSLGGEMRTTRVPLPEKQCIHQGRMSASNSYFFANEFRAWWKAHQAAKQQEAACN